MRGPYVSSVSRRDGADIRSSTFDEVKNYKQVEKALLDPAALPKQAEFVSGHRKMRRATIETDVHVWEHPHDGLIDICESAEMYSDFCRELFNA